MTVSVSIATGILTLSSMGPGLGRERAPLSRKREMDGGCHLTGPELRAARSGEDTPRALGE